MKVYVWKPTLIPWRWGHTSLELSDGTYISWWPVSGQKKAQKKGTRGEGMYDLAGDITREGREPDHTLTLNWDLDEEAIKEWWQSLLQNGQWHFIHSNCARAVGTALGAGGLREGDDWPFLPSPIHLFYFVKYNNN